MLMFSFSGGPQIQAVKEARLYGLADSTVDRLDTVMSDGSVEPLRMTPNAVAGTPYRAFAARVSPGALKAGVSPVAVVAYDASGAELARQETGLPSEGQ